MSTEKSQAVVLRLVPYSNTSLIVTLFTDNLGKIGVLAKGARRPKSPFEAALDLLAVCRVVFIHKSRDVLDLLTEAKLVRRFRSASRDLLRLYAGFYVAEITEGLTEFADPHPDLFIALERTLEVLDTGSDSPTWLSWYALHLLHEIGTAPALRHCVRCGRAADGTWLGLADGGVLCRACRAGRRHVLRLGRAAFGQIEALTESTEGPPKELAARAETVMAAVQLVHHQLGKAPRSWPFLRQALRQTAGRATDPAGT